MKKIIIISIILIIAIVYVMVNPSKDNSQINLLSKNIEVLTQGEGGGVVYKANVCVCGRVDFSNMKIHCHEGIGNPCNEYKCTATQGWTCY